MYRLGRNRDFSPSIHYVAMPYATLHMMGHRIFFMGHVGYAHAIGSDLNHDKGDVHNHSHDHRWTFVHPHKTTEVLYRMGLGLTLFSNHIQTAVLIDGQKPLSGPDRNQMVQGGGRIQIHLNHSLSLQADALVPLTIEKRWTNRIQLGIVARL